MNSSKITISPGNRKLGGIPSVSLPACVTCNPDAPCFKECACRGVGCWEIKNGETIAIYKH